MLSIRDRDLNVAAIGTTGEHHYAFHIEIPRFFGAASVTLIGGALPPFNQATFNLKNVRIDDIKISASFNKTMTAFPADWPDKADTKIFDLNRITGAAVVTYLRIPEGEPNPPPSGFLLVMDGFTEKGTCSKSERAF